MKPQVAAERTNDDGTSEDHLAAVTLGVHATLNGLAANVELLVEVINLRTCADAIEP